MPGDRSSNPYWTYLGGLNPASRANIKSRLDKIAVIVQPDGNRAAENPGELVPWHALSQERTALVRASLASYGDAGVWKASTVRAHLSALRCVLREASRLGHEAALEPGEHPG
jgi:hypothetical protein